MKVDFLEKQAEYICVMACLAMQFLIAAADFIMVFFLQFTTILPLAISQLPITLCIVCNEIVL